jgi:hypothetical protein
MIQSIVGNASVFVADYRGQNPEELANLAVDNLISIGEDLHPVIYEQAKAYREEMRKTLIHYFALAQDAAKTTIVGTLIKGGHADTAEMIRRL